MVGPSPTLNIASAASGSLDPAAEEEMEGENGKEGSLGWGVYRHFFFFRQMLSYCSLRQREELMLTCSTVG